MSLHKNIHEDKPKLGKSRPHKHSVFIQHIGPHTKDKVSHSLCSSCNINY